MGKKDKVDPAEGAEVAPEYQAGVLAMARARMEASNADAEQGLAEAAAQTQRLPPILARRRRCWLCLLYTSPSPRDKRQTRMPSSA